MDSVSFIVNPVAGSNSCYKRFQKLLPELERRGVPYTVGYTRYPGHATVLASEAVKNGEENFVSVGGDGTFREIASVLAHKKASLGMLPFGTGNDLARALKIPFEPIEALDIIYDGFTRPMDIGEANGGFFANVAGFGFDSAVLDATDKIKGKLKFKGMIPYLFGVCTAFFHLKPMNVEITTPEVNIKTTSVIVTVANGTHFGGGMNVSPNSDPFDGLFDVQVFHAVKRLGFLRLFPSFIRGKTDALPVECFRATSLSVRCEGSVHPLDLDGELQSKTPVFIRLLPGALNVFVRRIQS